MDKLWAPWRIDYITKIDTPKTKGCVFCRIAKEKKDKKNYVFIRSKYCYAVLNTYPYNNGHVLILPYRHLKDLERMTADEREDFLAVLMRAKALLKKVLNPQGFNIGLNLGRCAGAGVPGHIHFHIVPRWRGDVNFMPVTADVKVISQSLRELYERLAEKNQEQKR